MDCGRSIKYKASPLFPDQDGFVTPLVAWRADAVIHSGAGSSNALKVLAHGATFTLYVNDHKVGSYEDTTDPYTNGTCGVVAGFTTRTEAAFTDFVISVPKDSAQ